MSNDLDTYTLVGDPIARATHALEVARQQVRVTQSGTSARIEGALVDAKDAISEQLARIRNAITDDADGGPGRQRGEWYPQYRPA
jgi:hypothetical protein